MRSILLTRRVRCGSRSRRLRFVWPSRAHASSSSSQLRHSCVRKVRSLLRAASDLTLPARRRARSCFVTCPYIKSLPDQGRASRGFLCPFDLPDRLLVEMLCLLLLSPLHLCWPSRVVTIFYSQVRAEEIQGHRKNYRRAVFGGDLVQRLEEPELQSSRALQPVSCLPEAPGGLILPLRCDDL